MAQGDLTAQWLKVNAFVGGRKFTPIDVLTQADERLMKREYSCMHGP